MKQASLPASAPSAPDGGEESGSFGMRGHRRVQSANSGNAAWKAVLLGIRTRLIEGELPITAAGVAFYSLLATFPGLLALLGVYARLFDRDQIAEQLRFVQGQLDPEATRLLFSLIDGLSKSDRAGAGLGIAGGALVTLWGASLGVRALVRALNLVHCQKETRVFVNRHGLAILLTIGAIGAASCIGVALMSFPIVQHWLQPTRVTEQLLFRARWPVVAVLFWLSLLVLYRYGPSRAYTRWSWVAWGALFATAIWLGGTGVLAWYVAGSSRYHQAYGSVGVVVLVLAWFLLSAYAVLLGAVVSAELEQQVRTAPLD